MRSTWFAFVMCSLAFFRMEVSAAPPPNDPFSSPALISGFPSMAVGTNVDATMEVNEPLPDFWESSPVEASIWFEWTSPTSGPVRVDTLQSSFDTMLAVWTGATLSTLSAVAWNDEAYNSSQSAVYFDASQGETYRIAAYSWADERGVVYLTVTNDISSWISGTVSNTDGAVLAGIRATALTSTDGWGWNYVSDGVTDAGGSYTIRGLDSGSYRVGYYDPSGNYVSEIYDDAPDADSGDDIVVGVATNRTGINAELATASRIIGTVTGSDTGQPVQGVWASVRYPDGFGGYEWGDGAQTDATGTYSLGGLSAGTYRIEFNDSNGRYLREYYDNAQTVETATDITLGYAQTATGYDAVLDPGGRITGTITMSDGVTPLADIQVNALQPDGLDWEWFGIATSDTNGEYAIGGLPTGAYRVEFYDENEVYRTEVFSNEVSRVRGLDVSVTPPNTTSNINASMELAGGIAGRVTTGGTSPIPNYLVEFYQQNAGGDWFFVDADWTDYQGEYRKPLSISGIYRVWFGDTSMPYMPEAYSNAPNVSAGTDVMVGVGTIVSNINADLVLGGLISGMVTGSDGSLPLVGMDVQLRTYNGSWWETYRDVSTGQDGRFEFLGLPPDTYRINVYDYYAEFVSEAYDDVRDVDQGQDLVLGSMGEITNLLIALEYGGSFSGRVTDEDTGLPIEGVQVSAYRDVNMGTWTFYESDHTDTNGDYTIERLPAGDYAVEFADYRNDIYLAEVYSNAPTFNAGSWVTVVAGDTQVGIDAELQSGGQIVGNVYEQGTATPLNDIWVTLYRDDGSGMNNYDYWTSTATDASGQFHFGALESNTYRIWFVNSTGDHISEAYLDAPYLDSGTDIPVTAGSTANLTDTYLNRATRVAGSVQNTAGDGLGGIQIMLYKWQDPFWDNDVSTTTSSQGLFSLQVETGKTYRVHIIDYAGRYLPEYWDNAASLQTAQDVQVPEGTTAQVDATLEEAPPPQMFQAQSDLSGLQIRYQGIEGLWYTIQRTLSLTGGWEYVDSDYCEPGTNQVVVPFAEPSAYFRVISGN